MKQVFKGKAGSVMTSMLEIIAGVLLLINPVGFTSSIIIGAGAVMALLGVMNLVRYFLGKPEIGAQKQQLFKGMVLIMAGVVCITQYPWFLTAFPLLTVLYAGWMLVLAAMKLQQMADMLRAKAGRWYMPGIAALLAAVLAAIILVNPFGATSAVWVFVAVSLIAEATVELVSVIVG
ncbi:MAG: DUF308 domain-containing protein [Clostridia bacterium]|nr:DUF308 domain-containing protein [Clostridia bacterium]